MTIWPLDDKNYTAKSIGAFAGTRTRGVFSAEDCFSVTAMGGFRIKVSPGLAWLKKEKYWGVAAMEDSETELTVSVGSGVLPRWVAVCVLLDKTANSPKIELRYGEYAEIPVKPTPRRNSSFDEIIVASILQEPAATEITADKIHDERMNENMCGLMKDGVTGIPTAMLNAQAQALITGLETQIEQAAAGALPDGSVTPAKLANSTKELFAPAYTFGNVDKTPGSPSSEPEGTIYWVLKA